MIRDHFINTKLCSTAINFINKGEGKILELPNLKTKLRIKLEHEFEQSNKDLLLEDIKEFLIVNELNDATIQNLLQRKRLLHDLLISFLEDDEFNDLFEKKIRSLIRN